LTSPLARPATFRPAPAHITSDRFARATRERWLLVLTLIWGLFVGLPWLAPVLMELGWTGAAEALYTAYSFTCHQLPERSYFLFGPKTMYSLQEIQSAWPAAGTNNPLILRQFNGNDAMGWKVAWSDRMVSLYTSMLLGMLIYAIGRSRLPRLPLWVAGLLLVPMALDGGTHALSDLLGGRVGLGFRDSNAWLAALTGKALPATFYAGDAIGSLNWWLRLLTGVLMGLALVWLLLPAIDAMTGQGRPA
jgi:uncharacterized membrane protein